MTDDLPTQEVVARGGEPIWRVCWAGICIEARGGTEAMELLKAEFARRGIELPRHGPAQPMRGPSEVDEPGV
jgi:hypothetical protein